MKKSILLIACLCGLILPAMWAQETVEIVKAFPQKKSIVVEYDLAEDADFVRLFVSLDGGTTYLGIMEQNLNVLRQALA